MCMNHPLNFTEQGIAEIAFSIYTIVAFFVAHADNSPGIKHNF